MYLQVGVFQLLTDVGNMFCGTKYPKGAFCQHPFKCVDSCNTYIPVEKTIP